MKSIRSINPNSILGLGYLSLFMLTSVVFLYFLSFIIGSIPADDEGDVIFIAIYFLFFIIFSGVVLLISSWLRRYQDLSDNKPFVISFILFLSFLVIGVLPFWLFTFHNLILISALVLLLLAFCVIVSMKLIKNHIHFNQKLFIASCIIFLGVLVVHTINILLIDKQSIKEIITNPVFSISYLLVGVPLVVLVAFSLKKSWPESTLLPIGLQTIWISAILCFVITANLKLNIYENENRRTPEFSELASKSIPPALLVLLLGIVECKVGLKTIKALRSLAYNVLLSSINYVVYISVVLVLDSGWGGL